MGVQCQSMWHPRVNNSWTFVGKATKQWCTCDRRELCSSSHVKPPFSLQRGQYAATLTLEATFCSRIVCPPLERGSEICRRDFIWESVWRVFEGFYNPHSEFSVKSFVMKRTKGRSWSGMLLSRVHNLHSLYSRGIFLRRLSFRFCLCNFCSDFQLRVKIPNEIFFFKFDWTKIRYIYW